MNENENDVFKNLILFGPNGCGKTSYLNKIIEKSKKQKLKNIFLYNKESLKDSYDGKTNTFKKEISKNEKKLSLQNEEEKPPINKLEYSKYIKKLNSNNFDNENELIENELKIYSKTKEIDKFFDIETFIELNGEQIKLDEAPSGVKKFISLKYEINDEKIKNSKNEKILIIIDEFENHLHPWWINVICKLISQWIEDKNIYVMLSTHSPLVLENLKNHMEHFKTIKKINNEFQIKEMSEEKLFEEFNEYASKVWNNKLKNFEELLNKTKPRLAFELCKIFFSQKREILFVEGITDKIFFENKTEKIIINIYGSHNIPYTLFLVKYAGIDLAKISFILDGDGNLNDEDNNEPQFKTKEFLSDKGIKNFYFKKDIEQDLYKEEKRVKLSYEKFNLAFEWREKEEEIDWPDGLKEIL